MEYQDVIILGAGISTNSLEPLESDCRSCFNFDYLL